MVELVIEVLVVGSILFDGRNTGNIRQAGACSDVVVVGILSVTIDHVVISVWPAQVPLYHLGRVQGLHILLVVGSGFEHS